MNNFYEFFEPFKTKLNNSYKMTNDNIQNGFNTYFTTNTTSFVLKTPKIVKDEEIDSISKYFPSSEYISIIDVLSVINQECNFLSSFRHYTQDKEAKDYNYY